MIGIHGPSLSPIRRRVDGSLYELTPSQKKACDELCRKECSNYYQGNCLLLEDQGGTCPCVQTLSYHVTCRWFQDAVLLLNWKLEGEIFADENMMTCQNCGRRFRAPSAKFRYCPECRILVRKQKVRKNVARIREKNRGICNH